MKKDKRQQIYFQIILLALMCFFTFHSEAKDKEILGHLELETLILRPQFELQEGKKSNFGLGESYFGIAWESVEELSAHFKIGDRKLINHSPLYYDATVVKDWEIQFVEAYAQLDDTLGSIRLGLIPIHYGREGSLSEEEKMFSKTLMYKKGLIPFRDFGLSYGITHGGFSTQVAVHNGESESNKDNRIWYTGTWGWSNEKTFRGGIMGSVGATKPESTTNSTLSLINFDKTKESEWTIAGLFTEYDYDGFMARFELSVGELEQDNITQGQFYAGHIDVSGQFHRNLAWLARYDRFDPSDKVENDRIEELSLGFSFHNLHNTSRVLLIGTKVQEEGAAVNNDRLALIWHLTPVYLNPN